MSLLGDVAGFIGAGRAAKAVSGANIAAEHGVLNATQAATTGLEDQKGTNAANIGQAGANVTTAANSANAGLEATRGNVNSNLQSYLQSGTQGNEMAQAHAAANPQFNFSLQDYLNSPAMKFQMDSGTSAITSQLAAQGIGAGSNALQQLTNYGQGLASTYYNQAFNQAQSQFQTNQNATMQNIQQLVNSGEFGTNQYNSGNIGITSQQGANTTGAANTNANLQEVLANINTGAQIHAGDTSLQGADLAGKYAVGAGQATAGGIMNQAAGASAIGSDIFGLAAGGGEYGIIGDILGHP